jgi:hypothetical protein
MKKILMLDDNWDMVKAYLGLYKVPKHIKIGFMGLYKLKIYDFQHVHTIINSPMAMSNYYMMFKLCISGKGDCAIMNKWHSSYHNLLVEEHIKIIWKHLSGKGNNIDNRETLILYLNSELNKVSFADMLIEFFEHIDDYN